MRMTHLAAAGSLDPQGPAADAIADLWWLMLALGTAVFVLFGVLLVAGLLRRGPADEAHAGDGGDDGDGDDGPDVRRWVIGGGVVMPLAVLLVVFVATIVAMRAIPTSASSDALVVEVVGSQFRYDVRYPAEGVTAVDELHIPVGRPVALELTSTDVIHSFWVPELGGKMDMLPDGTNLLVLEADEPGEHTARCAEFCGLEHSRMEMVVVAEPPEDFAAWVEERR